MNSNYPEIKVKKKRGCCLWYVLLVVLVGGILYLGFDQGYAFFSGLLGDGLAISQLRDFYALQRDTGKTIEMENRNQVLRSLIVNVPTSGNTSQQRVASVVDQYPDLFGIDDFDGQFELVREKQMDNGNLLVKFRQNFEKVPVYQGSLVVELDSAGDFLSVNGGYIPHLEDLNIEPVYSSDAAFDMVAQKEKWVDAEISGEPYLTIYDRAVFGEGSSKPILSWVIVVTHEETFLSSCIIDSNTANLIDCNPLAVNALSNIIYYDAENNGEDWLVDHIDDGKYRINQFDMTESDSVAVSDSHFRSISDHFYNYQLDCTEFAPDETHVFLNYKESAFFCPVDMSDGRKIALFVFDPLCLTQDIVAHEYTHSVFYCLLENKMTVSAESLAINEGLADSFAAMIDEGDPWRIMKANDSIIRVIDTKPEGTSQVYSYKKFKNFCPLDKKAKCGHLNSTILSHAVYLMSEGGTSEDGKIQVQGIGKEKVGIILFKTMTRVSENVTFEQFRNEAEFMCETYISPDTNLSQPLTDADCDEVINAFAAVGVGESAEQEAKREQRKSPVPRIDFDDLEKSINELIEDLKAQIIARLEQEAQNQFDQFIDMILQSLLEWIEWFINLFIAFIGA